MQVEKAVVLAGDSQGSARWPSLGLPARQLAPVANRPVLFHHLDALALAGVQEAAIVTDATTRAAIREAVGDGSDWGLKLVHVEHEEAGNVLASRPICEFVDSAPVLVHHGDILLRECLSALEGDFADQGLDALILRPSVQRTRPAPSVGYIIGSEVQASLRRDTAVLDDGLRRLRDAGARIGVREVDACMPCRGGADELLVANRRMLEGLQPRHRGERIFDSDIQGAVELHPSAEVRASLIRGPVAIGPRARICNSYVGPYTSIGPDVDIDCVEIEHSIAMEGARLHYLATRVEGSVVGPRARVTRDFTLPRAMRLSIGEGVEISLC